MSALDELVAKLTKLPPAKILELEQEALKITGASVDWFPNEGPQTEAYFCPADILLYGGQGGGGKSDLLLGLATTAQKRSLIMRRRYNDLLGITRRAVEIVGTRDGFSASPRPKFDLPGGRIIDFGAAQHPGDEESWQGQPHDLLGIDEATQFLEQQIRFLMGWVRSTDPSVRKRTVLATNPPTSATGDWIVGMFRPWLDITHPKPAKAGELRWFVTAPDGKDLEVDGPTPVDLPDTDRPLIPLSRTFIPAALRDNPYLVNTGYQAQLDGLPEPLRSAVRDGNFMAARADDPWQVVPTQWVIEAQARWTEKPPEGIPLCSLAVDVAQGGGDETVLAMRHDWWFAPLVAVPGEKTPDGPSVAALVVAHRRGIAPVIVDMGGGYGGSARDHLKANGVECVAYKGAEATKGRTKDRQFGFYNTRSEIIWRFREALDPSQEGGSPIALPPDARLVADLTAPTYEVTPRGIKIETKEDVVKRLGRSTDRGDAVCMAWSAGITGANVKGGWKRNRNSVNVNVITSRPNARRR